MEIRLVRHATEQYHFDMFINDVYVTTAHMDSLQDAFWHTDKKLCRMLTEKKVDGGEYLYNEINVEYEERGRE